MPVVDVSDKRLQAGNKKDLISAVLLAKLLCKPNGGRPER